MIARAKTAWRNTPFPARWILGAAIVVVALNLLVALAGAASGEGSTGPPNSTYSTGPAGLAGLRRLLAEYGHPVERLRSHPSHVELDTDATLFVIGPDEVDEDDSAALKRFVRQGGRLVGGGIRPQWAPGDGTPMWSPDRLGAVEPIVPLSAGAAGSSITTNERGSWNDPRGWLPLVGNERGVLLVEAAAGRGRTLLLSDVSPLHNDLLDEADNAAFALALAGEPGRPVIFAEIFHGYGGGSGWAALPSRWRSLLAGLAAATVLFMWARGRRLGVPEEQSRALPPPRRAYVDALATTLARTRRPSESVAPVTARARIILARRTGATGMVDDETLRATATRLGLDEIEIDAVLGKLEDNDDVIAAGRALAKLTRDIE